MALNVLFWRDHSSSIDVHGVTLDIVHRRGVSYDRHTRQFRVSVSARLGEQTFVAIQEVAEDAYWMISNDDSFEFQGKLVNDAAWVYASEHPGSIANLVMGSDAVENIPREIEEVYDLLENKPEDTPCIEDEDEDWRFFEDYDDEMPHDVDWFPEDSDEWEECE